MQTNIITKEKKFEPIEVTFIIESKRELEAFLSVFNAHEKMLSDFANQNKPGLLSNTSDFRSNELGIFPDNKWAELADIYRALPIFILSLASFWNEIKTIGLHIMAGA